MEQEAFIEITPEIQAYGEGMRTLREALETGDGRDVKAACAELAIRLFQLGEAAEKRSVQKYLS